MKASTIFLGLVALTSTAFAADLGDPFISVYSNKDSKPTAKANSSFWKKIKGITVVNDYFGQPIPGYQTEVRSRWTANNLYILWISSYKELTLKPDPEIQKETNQLWNWDVAEAFIGMDPKEINRYREFEVSPRGEWVDLNIDRTTPRQPGPAGWMWNSGLQAVAHVDEKKHIWYAEMSIPWNALMTGTPADGVELRANFFLSMGPSTNKKNLAWRKTDRRSFHVPEAFGLLRLAKKQGK